MLRTLDIFCFSLFVAMKNFTRNLLIFKDFFEPLQTSVLRLLVDIASESDFENE